MKIFWSTILVALLIVLIAVGIHFKNKNSLDGLDKEEECKAVCCDSLPSPDSDSSYVTILSDLLNCETDSICPTPPIKKYKKVKKATYSYDSTSYGMTRVFVKNKETEEKCNEIQYKYGSSCIYICDSPRVYHKDLLRWNIWYCTSLPPGIR